MRIIARVKTGCASDSVTVAADGSLSVRVHARPERGRANEAVVRAVAQHFKVARSRVNVSAGHSSRTKVIVIG